MKLSAFGIFFAMNSNKLSIKSTILTVKHEPNKGLGNPCPALHNFISFSRKIEDLCIGLQILRFLLFLFSYPVIFLLL